MKNLLSIPFCFLMSCSPSLDDNKDWSLSETEIQSILNEGYLPYLDSLNRTSRVILNRAILEDSTNQVLQIQMLERKNQDLFFSDEITFDQIRETSFESKTWNPELFPDYTFIKMSEIDTLLRQLSWEVNHNLEVYAISSPFRPDSSEHVVLQEFEVVPPNWRFCGTGVFGGRSLFFEKRSKGWSVVKVIPFF